MVDATALRCGALGLSRVVAAAVELRLHARNALFIRMDVGVVSLASRRLLRCRQHFLRGPAADLRRIESAVGPNAQVVCVLRVHRVHVHPNAIEQIQIGALLLRAMVLDGIGAQVDMVFRRANFGKGFYVDTTSGRHVNDKTITKYNMGAANIEIIYGRMEVMIDTERDQ